MKKRTKIGLLFVCACGTLFASACGALGNNWSSGNHVHAYGEWTETLAPTYEREGERSRRCNCGETETQPVEKLVAAYTVTVVDGDEQAFLYVQQDGEYTLPVPQIPVGYSFAGWKDEAGETFSESGVVSEDVTVYAQYEILETSTFEQLKTRVEGGAKEIYLTADIVLTDTVYVVDDTTVYCTADYTLIRGENFLGDLFVLGRTAQGENVTVQGRDVQLCLQPRDSGTLTVDGNKAAVTGAVSGTAFFVENSATLSMYDGVQIVNHKKTANEYLLSDDHHIGDPELVGGAAVIIANGAFDMYGGTIGDCEVDMDDSAVTDSAAQTDGYNYSSRGGAIFNYSTFRMYGGVIENCQGGRGGALYNYRVAYVYGGVIRNNYSASYGGVMYQPNSQYIYSVWGKTGTEITMTVSGNTSGKSGGAFYVAHQSTVYVQGGTQFVQNGALSGNGGAMNVAGELVVDYAKFTGNTASSKGGAIYAYYSELENIVRIVRLKSGVFSENSAPRGGALALGKGDAVSTGAKVEIGNVTFENNTALHTSSGKYGYGGAVHIDNASTVNVYGSATFADNTADENGGAVYATKQSLFTANVETGKTVTFRGNVVNNGNGGAIYNSNSVITLAANGGAVLAENNVATAGNGGAFAVHSQGTLKLYGVTAQNNTATAGNGGALYVYGASAVVGDETYTAVSTFSGNQAEKGGAVYISTTDTVSVDVDVYEMIVTGNSATGGGGAVYITVHADATDTTATTATLDASVLRMQNNTSGGNGGAMYVYTSATVNVGELYAEGNSTADGKYGGVAYVSGGASCTIGNIVASGNTASKGGCLYLTTTGTALTLNGGDITGNTATATDGGNAIWVNSTGSVLTVKTGTVYAADDILGKDGFEILTA